MEGWIKLHRNIQDHWIYKEKRTFSKYEAWLDMIMMANHKENKFLLGNELIKVSRGQFITSELKLMEKWGWSKTKLRNFLKMLEKDGMILKESDNKKTTITIVNYSDWQDQETTERPQEDHKKTTERPQEDTNKNEKNEKNEKNINNRCKLKFGNESMEYKLANYLKNWMIKNNSKAKVPNTDRQMDNWSQHIDYMLRIDKRDPEEIKEIIRFCQTNSFWMTNVLSTKKLREKYDSLYLQMKKSNVVPLKGGSEYAGGKGNNQETDQYDEVKTLKLGKA
ncbi:hypothetical protein [Wukongibacter sp. M2B1]|uniref:hypothetical protein n=1 Tax=Wukongibacter sp. M2B1 TaxID=3088895 RepID=UPI003D78F16F